MLLVSQRTDDLAFATEAARSAKLRLVATRDLTEAIKIIGSEELSATLVDASSEPIYRAFETKIQDSFGLFSDRLNPNQVHFISSEVIDAVPYLTTSPLFGHVVLRRFDNPVETGQHYGRVISATQKERAFGLESLMKPEAKIQNISLVSSSQKQRAVDAVRSYMIAAKFQTRIATVIANAVDEILMNAIFNAPIDTAGRPIYGSTSRATALNLEGQDKVEMQVGYDGTYIGITAIDHHGSLDKAKLLRHVTKIYTEDEYKVKMNQAGAGIGLATICRTGGSFFFSSEAGERTEVTVFFRKADSYREFKNQFRFFSTQFYF